jgi:plastocyanin
VDDDYLDPVNQSCANRTGVADDPYCTIQDGIDKAVFYDSLITVKNGTYNENITFNNKMLNVFTDEGAVIDGDLGGDSIPDGSVVTFTGGDESTLDGFSITNGGGTFNSIGSTYSGGGLFITDNSSPSITNCNIDYNSADYGGGIFITNDSSPSITNSIIANNSAEDGGGIYADNSSSPVLYESTISLNQVSQDTTTGNGGRGGGIHFNGASSPSFLLCNIDNNSAEMKGGGIYGINSTSLNITFSFIRDNFTFGISDGTDDVGSGGGIYGRNTPLTIDNTNIEYNQGQYGGGLYIRDLSSTISNSKIEDNAVARDGGGFYSMYSSHSITNCIIGGNTADMAGGGFFFTNNSWPVFHSCTIVGNEATSLTGGGIHCLDSTAAVVNSILWGNLPVQVEFDVNSSININYSDIQGGWGTGTGNIDLDPMMITLPLNKYNLEPSSPCIDKGTAAGAPNNDLAGRDRPFDVLYMPNPYSTFDMGAYEIYTETLATVNSGEEITFTNTDVILTFDNITNTGQTTVTALSEGTTPPANFEVEGQYYNITTTATFTNSVKICLVYNIPDMTDEQELGLKLLHYNDDVIPPVEPYWEDTTIPSTPSEPNPNTVNNIICGTTTSLSEFVIASPETTYVDVDGDGYTNDVDCDDNNPTINPGAPELCDDGLDNNCDGEEAVTPTVDSITVPISVIPIGESISAQVDFTDPNQDDSHTITWDWGDDSDLDEDFVQGPRSVSHTHTYDTPGVYTINLTVSEDYCDSSTQEEFSYVVVYDPDGGFVTGGGWIMSPEGAYTDDPTLTGKANFGFVSKYHHGTNIPTGQTEFQFKVAGLNFHSDNYEWLVVAGARAQYKGEGTINGIGNYGFMLTAIDGAINGGGGTDKFRIKIWDKDNSDEIVYDNNIGEYDDYDDADPTTEIGGGSIVIHHN